MRWPGNQVQWSEAPLGLQSLILPSALHFTPPTSLTSSFFSSERRKQKEKTIQDFIYIYIYCLESPLWPTEIYVSVIIIIIFKGFPPAALFLFRFDLLPLDGMKIGHLHLFHTQSSDKDKKNNPVVHFCMFSVCEHKWHWGRWGGFSSMMKKGAVKLCSLM